MNFFERVRTGRLFGRGKRPEKTDNRIQRNGPGMVIKFYFMDKTYIVEDFDIHFKQDIDKYKNKADSLPYGGIMSVTLSEPPDHSINEWMMQTYMVRDGEIRFLSNKSKIRESPLFSISFFDAYCIKYQKKIDAAEYGLLTTIVISPRLIKIGNEEFENNWNKKDNLSHYIRSI